MRLNRFGVPVFYDTDKLIKHAVQDKDMEWDYRDSDLYEHAWQSTDGTDLWIEDVTKMLSDTPQTHMTDFKNDRYRVLEQEFYQPEGVLQETFDDMDDALEYVEENYDLAVDI